MGAASLLVWAKLCVAGPHWKNSPLSSLLLRGLNMVKHGTGKHWGQELGQPNAMGHCWKYLQFSRLIPALW